MRGGELIFLRPKVPAGLAKDWIPLGSITADGRFCQLRGGVIRARRAAGVRSTSFTVVSSSKIE